MDSNILDLKQAVIDKLRSNGTLDRIQAELQCAVFLAIESNENNEVKVDESKLSQRFGYSMIYHFLRQNRFLATAAVFEKEIHQKIISLEELKKENAATLCFQIFGDTITLSDSTLTGTERKMEESSSIRIRCSETNDTESNFIPHFEKNIGGESDVQITDKQQIVNPESSKTFTSGSTISRDENEVSNSSIRNEWKSERGRRNDGSFRKLTNDEIQKYNKESSSNSESTKIFEQQQTSNISSVTISKDQQQSPKHITPLSSSYSKKLPPIALPLSSQSVSSIKLPSIPSLNSPLTQTKTVAFSHLLDTVLNSPSSNKSEIDEDIAEEVILDDMLRSDNESDATISF